MIPRKRLRHVYIYRVNIPFWEYATYDAGKLGWVIDRAETPEFDRLGLWDDFIVIKNSYVIIKDPIFVEYIERQLRWPDGSHVRVDELIHPITTERQWILSRGAFTTLMDYWCWEGLMLRFVDTSGVSFLDREELHDPLWMSYRFAVFKKKYLERVWEEQARSDVQVQPYHLVTRSPWPLVSALSAFLLALSLIVWMHFTPAPTTIFGISVDSSWIVINSGILAFFMAMSPWLIDIVGEGTDEGNHDIKVQQGLRIGMILFIISEIMFFFGFFWTFFHSSLSPALDVGCLWPPAGIPVLSPWGLPFVNTIILLSSGICVTWAHRAILSTKRRQAVGTLIMTLALGLIFTTCQAYEYLTAPFGINDGGYGSLFYMATGFHGFHVIIGAIFLSVSLIRQIADEFTQQHHFGFEAAAWYWHFVDVVWLFLFTTLYWWGT